MRAGEGGMNSLLLRSGLDAGQNSLSAAISRDQRSGWAVPDLSSIAVRNDWSHKVNCPQSFAPWTFLIASGIALRVSLKTVIQGTKASVGRCLNAFPLEASQSNAS